MYPQLCNIQINPIYPVVNYPCGYVGCVMPYNYNNCAVAPYSAIYGYRPGCTYPIYNGYNNICGYGIYANPCNGPYIGGVPSRVNLAVSPAIATCTCRTPPRRSGERCATS